MASLVMSAAVPWIGVLMAARSALDRTVPLEEVMSGKRRRRPEMVSVKPRSLAPSIVVAMNSLILGYSFQ